MFNKDLVSFILKPVWYNQTMKRITFSAPLFVAIIGLSIISTGFFATSTYAETVVTKTAVTTTSTDSTATTASIEPATGTAAVKEKAKNIWTIVRAWGISVYEKVDAWRVQQSGIWRDIKAEKELQITSLSQTTEENRNERVDNVLNGDQGTLFQGSGQDFKGNGNVFLLKLYVFALNIFLFVFTTPIIFYGIITIALLAIINKIIQKIRNPHDF